MFTVSLGKNREGELSGLYFEHSTLGRVTVINEDQAVSRWAFTLAHELAHGLYHHDRPAILCRGSDQRPLEVFTNRFAGHFLVPEKPLHDRLDQMGVRCVNSPEQIVALCRYFGVSFRAMVKRLETESRLQVQQSDLAAVRPVLLAKKLGFRTSSYEFGVRPLPIEEPFPRILLQLAYQAVRERLLSLRRVAEILGVSYLDLQDRLEATESEEELEDPKEVVF